MSSFSSSNIICQSVNLTDELKIGLEYDIHDGLLNIFIKNTGNIIQLPSQINILSDQNKESQLIYDNHEYLINSSKFQQDFQDEINNISYGKDNHDDDDDDEPKICIELSNIYVYDLYDEYENDLCQTMIRSSPLLCSSSSSSSSSCFDDHTIDNDDGYSTHSLDDIEQQHSPSISSTKSIIPFMPYQHHSSEIYISSIHRLMNEIIWLNPFKKTLKQMMMNNCLFD